MTLQPLRQTFTAPVVQYDKMDLAYADLNGTGSYEPETDCVLFHRSKDFSGGAMSYSELRQAVEDRGGRATAAELSGQKDGRSQAIETDWISFAQMPPGLNHPIVDYLFRLEGDRLMVDYTVQNSAVVAPSGEAAGYDFDANGEVAPDHDSLIMLRFDNREGGGLETMVRYDELRSAVAGLGGSATEQDLMAPMIEACPSPFLEADRVFRLSAGEFPPRLHGEEPNDVIRTFRLAEDGTLYADFSVKQHERYIPSGA